jgi:HSP20 family protein
MAGRDLGREIEELFADLWQLPRIAGLQHGFRPPTDCFRTEDPPQLVVVCDIAGVDPNAVQILAADGMLLIAGRRERPRDAARRSYRQMEIDYGTFRRRIALEDGVDLAAARATYTDGLLTVVLPLTERKPRKTKASIEVVTRTD